MAGKRLFYIEFIRAISLLIIVVFHFNWNLSEHGQTAPLVLKNFYRNIDLGSLGVAMFVMLSGSSLMLSYGEKLNLRDFYARRALSIFPLYWTAYVVWASFMFVMSGHLSSGPAWWTPILTVTGFDGFLLYKIPNYYLLGEWFTGMILCLYVVFPLLRLAVNRSAVGSLIVSVVMLGLVHHFYDRFFQMPDFRSPLIQVWFMVFGMAFVKLFPKMGWKSASVILVAAVVVAKITLPWPYTLKIMIVSAVGFSILALIGDRALFAPTLQEHIKTLAKYSYPMFLVHHVLIVWLVPQSVFPMTQVEVWWRLGIVLALTFVLGYVVERIASKVVVPYFAWAMRSKQSVSI